MGIQTTVTGLSSVSDVYGMYMYIANSCAPSGGSACIRMDDDSVDTYETDAFLMMSCKKNYGPLYVMQFQTAAGHAFTGDGYTCSGYGGYLKVYLSGSGGGSGARYIQLFTAAS